MSAQASIQDSEFFERLLIKSALESQQYMALLSSVVNPTWFDNSAAAQIYIKLSEYFKEYKKIPEKEIIYGLVDNKDQAKEYLDSCNALDINVANNFDFILNESEQWIKSSALKSAILDSADIINNNEDYGKIDKLIRTALSKSIKFNLGSDYWNTLGERLTRMFTEVKRVIPSYYPTLDELISGGFPPKTLNMLVARTHGFKCTSGHTKITVKNKKTNDIKQIKIGEFVSSHINNTNHVSTQLTDDEKYRLFAKKYGEEEAKIKWNKYQQLKQNPKDIL
jgi:hypothetical protein